MGQRTRRGTSTHRNVKPCIHRVDVPIGFTRPEIGIATSSRPRNKPTYVASHEHGILSYLHTWLVTVSHLGNAGLSHFPRRLRGGTTVVLRGMGGRPIQTLDGGMFHEALQVKFREKRTDKDEQRGTRGFTERDIYQSKGSRLPLSDLLPRKKVRSV